MASTTAGDVNRVASGEKSVVFLAKNFVTEFQGAGPGFQDASADGEEFIVAGRMVVATVGISDDYVGVVIEFHSFVIEAERTHQFNPADFKPDQVIGMVDHAHLIGFGVAHAYGDIVVSEHVQLVAGR